MADNGNPVLLLCLKQVLKTLTRSKNSCIVKGLTQTTRQVFGTDYRRKKMFEAPYCWCCGKKEHLNGYGCNNPECKEYYKLKELKLGAKNTEQQVQVD